MATQLSDTWPCTHLNRSPAKSHMRPISIKLILKGTGPALSKCGGDGTKRVEAAPEPRSTKAAISNIIQATILCGTLGTHFRAWRELGHLRWVEICGLPPFHDKAVKGWGTRPIEAYRQSAPAPKNGACWISLSCFSPGALGRFPGLLLLHNSPALRLGSLG